MTLHRLARLIRQLMSGDPEVTYKAMNELIRYCQSNAGYDPKRRILEQVLESISRKVTIS